MSDSLVNQTTVKPTRKIAVTGALIAVVAAGYRTMERRP